MKRFLISLGGVLLLSGVSQAVNKSNTGCGLGYVAMKDQEGLVFEVLAVTTNGTSFNQTFGITFGTLECEKPTKVAVDDRVHTFVSMNLDELAGDIAKGEGNYLETLADLLEIPASQRESFFAELNRNFDEIFSDERVSSAQVLERIYRLLPRRG
jgi:hypothetical protein